MANKAFRQFIAALNAAQPGDGFLKRVIAIRRLAGMRAWLESCATVRPGRVARADGADDEVDAAVRPRLLRPQRRPRRSAGNVPLEGHRTAGEPGQAFSDSRRGEEGIGRAGGRTDELKEEWESAPSIMSIPGPIADHPEGGDRR